MKHIAVILAFLMIMAPSGCDKELSSADGNAKESLTVTYQECGQVIEASENAEPGL